MWVCVRIFIMSFTSTAVLLALCMTSRAHTSALCLQEETMKENSPPNANQTKPNKTNDILYAQCIWIYVKCFNLSTDYFYILLKHANAHSCRAELAVLQIAINIESLNDGDDNNENANDDNDDGDDDVTAAMKCYSIHTHTILM